MTQPEPSIAKDLLSYWMEYPEAEDTLEGIAEWWLLERYVRRRLADVRQALNELVERGFVVAWRDSDGRMHYRLNPRHLPEIHAFLAEEPGRGASQST